MSEFEDKLQSILGDPQAMGQIMSMARALSGENQAAESPSDCNGDFIPTDTENNSDLFSMLGDIDPRWLQLGMQLLAEYHSGDERKTALLNALQPFLRKERSAKLDRALQAARISHVIRVAVDALRNGGAGLV